MNRSVLVLNQNYEALNVCSVRRALVLVIEGKAEILESRPDGLRASTRVFPWPSVIRMMYLIRRPRPRVKLTRREIFIRDGFTCQYCGRHGGDLTIDHINPRSLGGGHSWENLVTACKSCNHRKGGKTLMQCKMDLRTTPHEPRAGAYYAIERRLDQRLDHAWEKFLPGFVPLPASSSSLRRSSP
ncbi:MAG TPA: HNH endonuclease [Thermomicrobiales bacterium]|nr:HNH endonuclease [Thermomicrobiales bacterium]